MNHSEEIKGPLDASETKRAPKRPYRKPAVRYERVFETRALICGKVQETQSGCAHNRKNS